MSFRFAKTIRTCYKHPSTYFITAVAFFPEITQQLIQTDIVDQNPSLKAALLIIAIISSYLREKK